jgi:hypothetical protein
MQPRHHILCLAFSIFTSTMSTSTNPSDVISRIKSNALRDAIDLSILPFHKEALDSIASLSITAPDTNINISTLDFSTANKVDCHTHPIPPWFHALEPMAAGRATPEWSVDKHLEFMASRGIRRSVLSVSTPQGNAFNYILDEEERRKKTVALARLLNEYVAEVCRLWLGRFSWLAVTTLPYVSESVVEFRYAMELGAIGVSVLTNSEGRYPGDEGNDALWEFLDARGGRGVVFIHPTEPVIKLDDGRLINSRPCKSNTFLSNTQSKKLNPNDALTAPLRSGLGEFYFETARAISSITASSTLQKFPNLHWRISHGAGAFPDIAERFLLGFPALSDSARNAYSERFWYDSAGPVFPKQVRGLTEGMGVPSSQFVFGTVSKLL